MRPGLASPRGAGSARPHGNALASPWHVPARPPASRLLLARHALPRACVRPCRPGAETAPLRENSLSRYLPVLPVRPCVLGLPPPGGAGSHARKGRHCAKPKTTPFWPRARRQPTGENEMAWHPHGCTPRARRPRPSEKTAFRVISRFPPLGHLASANPPEGRAPHARKEDTGLTRAYPR
jgi:hypothetical protein